MFLLSTLLSIPYPFTTLSKSDVKEKGGKKEESADNLLPPALPCDP